jgi:hypothetical protein
MRRSKRCLAASVIASLLGSSVAWSVALWMAPLSAYEVSLHIDDGRFAIVLDRRPPSERTSRHGDPAMNDGDGLHDEHVVTVATLDDCATIDSGTSTKLSAPAIVTIPTIDVGQTAPATPCAVSLRTRPPRPPSFSVLRI